MHFGYYRHEGGHVIARWLVILFILPVTVFAGIGWLGLVIAVYLVYAGNLKDLKKELDAVESTDD